MNTTPDEQRLTNEEQRQLTNTIAALILAGCGAVCLSLVAQRVPLVRRMLGSDRWRMRATMASFALSYTALSRLRLDREEDTEAPRHD